MEQIAIVGMAALFPGAGNLDEYWRNLVAGQDNISDVPEDRFDALFYDPDNAHRPDRLYTRRGGFLDDATFEPLKFGIMPNSVGDIEPDQLIALEVASAAIADAGGPEKMPDADRIGVILGRGGILSPAAARYAQRVRMSSQVIGILRELFPDLDEDRLDLVRARFDERLGKHQPEGTIGLVPNLAASRVANRLNLRGPAYTIDAACASSLLAVDQGMTELSNGRLDAVLAGGVHHVHDISFWSVFSQLQALSRKGTIRPFDADADGVLIGEGTGMVVLKRLADAERDGDRVYAVIRGSGTSSDGRSASMFNPASSGQTLAIRRAWEMAGLDPTAPDALGLLEAHGTATPTGDAAELTTVAEVFGPHVTGDRPVIGSVKSMIGHAMPAAGVAGLIKATLAVYHGTLLPTLNVTNPRSEMAATRFQPIPAARPWESEGPRRAGVNAFGFGGINAHVIIEQHAAPVGAVQVREPERVLRLAAGSVPELAALLDRPDVRDLPQDTEAGPVRLGLFDPSDQRLGIARKMVARGEAWRGGRDIWFTPRPLLGAGGGKLAFVFPGVEAEFAPRTADVAAHFGLPHREWTAADLGQHGTGLVEVGRQLDIALRRMNIKPDAVAGHSIGEWTAAAVTGQMSTQGVDAFLGIFDADSVEVSGYAFAAISAGVESIEPVLVDYPGVVLSHDNAPHQCVVNGPRDQVQRLVEDLRARTILCQLLPFRSAFHTPVFAEGLQAIGAALGHWEVHPTEVPVWSGTTSAPFPTDPDEVNALFIRHMIEPVRFRQTVDAMYASGIRVFLQVGAGQLASLIDDNLRDREHLAMPVNVSRRSGLEQLHRVATALWVDGGAPDLAAITPAAAPARVNTVAGPAARKGPAIKLDLGGPLVKLGEGADRLLAPSGTPTAQRPMSPAPTSALPTQRPAIPAQRPASTTQRPPVPAQRTATAAQGPAVAAQGVAAPAQRAGVAAQRPAPPAQRPANPGQRPAVPAQGAAAPVQRPAGSTPRTVVPAQRPPAPAPSHVAPRPEPQRPAVPAASAGASAEAHSAALSALGKLAGSSKAAAELAALLQETANDAVTVMTAATTTNRATPAAPPRVPPAAPPRGVPATPARGVPAAQTRTAPAAPSRTAPGVPGRVGPAAPGSGHASLPGSGSDGPGSRASAVPATGRLGEPGTSTRPVPEKVFKTTLDVSVETMPYLRDHCFFVQPDDWPQVEDRWPVVPATTVVQHMMDAAEQAVPGLKAVAVLEAKFHRWLIAAPAQQVEITVKTIAPNRVAVVFGGYAKSIVELAADYPEPAEAPWTHDPATERPPTTSAETMYAERLMFHGPQFQGVTAVHALGDMHVRGVVTAPVPPGALLDNALQLIGNWLITTQPFRTVALPVGLRHVKFYGPPPAAGTAFECVARVREITDGELIADTQLSVGGRVWAQIDGATDRRFDSHPTARACERFPEKFPMSQRRPEGWTLVFDAWTDLVTRGMAARGILGGEAAVEYERMPGARKKQWMLGRIAAKDAVRFRQWDAGHTDVYPIELTVRNEPSGRPYVELRPGRGLVESEVSIAHTAEIGVAIAGDKGSEVGIDVTEIVARDDSTIRYALTDAEIAALGPDRELAFARMWAAKEAVGKALGTGLDGAPRRFVTDIEAGTVTAGDRTFRVGTTVVENPPELPPRRYVVAWTTN
ncbi:type I polyketide synthase [Actinoplanes friuliensis]|uniref:Beta-ketoacyl synthase n=1 Tax=Actinoplanes friuliensis DSM 7358 TaxID=1246995 RepID=U5WE54_9ACTN|nr:type I polyketide synthase [Actinoplanes friuliensis]AGZ46206.1 beta-ketoacyl synthase [Actinoplanes friuliensis DSM 7358]